MSKPSDLSPLFSDEDASPEEIARARRIVAIDELKDAIRQRYFFAARIEGRGDERQLYASLEIVDKKIVALVLELFPE